MARLQLRLLGPFQAEVDGQTITHFRSDKVRALLAYLALESGRPHRRESLAALLWPDMPDEVAHSNLRKSLHRLRQALASADPDAWLLIDRQSVQLERAAVDVDAVALLDLITACDQHAHRNLTTCTACVTRLLHAAGMCVGEFLAGFSLDGGLPFDEWLVIRREALHQQAMLVFHNLAVVFEERGQPEQALVYADRQLVLEPWREEAHRQRMRSLARAGRRSEALAQYAVCRRALADALALEPSEATQALFRSLRDGPARAESRLVRGAPPEPTPFVGRSAELAQIRDRLLDSDCRLISLVGPGGIGKSRLGLRVAQASAALPIFCDGVVVVPVEAVSVVDRLWPAIAVALGLYLSEGTTPQDQLRDYLSAKQLLLVLDGFEQLVSAGVHLTRLLEQAPGLKVLVTTRERLGLRAEWVVPVEGLSYPPDSTPIDLDLHSAGRLFVDVARRAQPTFDPDVPTRLMLARLCRLVAGSPLALEIAAAWLPRHSPTEIVAAIERGLDFLETPWKDVPARHLSLRAVFNHSWALLTAVEQHTLARLSVFRGGFDGEAAGLAGADASLLSSLSAKSLLRDLGAGRYDLHALVREFAAERLRVDEATDMLKRHADFYLTCLARAGQDFVGPRVREVLKALRLDLDNVRAAWAWAVAHGDITRLAASAEGLAGLFRHLGLLQEGEDSFGLAVAATSESDRRARCRLLTHRADFATRTGRVEEAEGWVRLALELGGTFEVTSEVTSKVTSEVTSEVTSKVTSEVTSKVTSEVTSKVTSEVTSEVTSKVTSEVTSKVTSEVTSKVPAPPADVVLCQAQIVLGRLLELQGHYPEALAWLDPACAVLAAQDPGPTLALALNRRANVYWRQGAYASAMAGFQAALDIDEQHGHQVGMSMHLGNMGIVLREQGHYERAEACLRRALDIDQALAIALGCARHLNNLGLVHWQTGQRADALDCYQRALAIAEDLGHKRGIALCIGNIGILERELGHFDAARVAYERALGLARELGAMANVANYLGNMGNVERELGRFKEAQTHYAEALHVAQDIGSAEVQARVLGYLGDLHYDLGQLEPARDYFERGVVQLRQLGARYYLAWQLIALAEIRFAQDAPAEAQALVEEGGALASTLGRQDYVLRARNLQARLAKARVNHSSSPR